MKRAWYAIIGTLVLAIGSVALVVHAQSAPIDLSLTTMPLNPQPGDQVTVTAQSYGADITQATLVWTYNGKVIASDLGETQVTVTAPSAGNTGTLTVTVSGGTFTTTSSTLVLRPGSLDLLWEGADSYTPPFYKGRAMPSTDGVIRVTAVPAASAPSQLTYNWTQNDNVLQDNSGYGKSSIIFKNNELNSTENIGVTADNSDFSVENTIAITPGAPSLVGYFNKGGYIDYANGSTSQLTTTSSGAILHFEPYFFSAPVSIGKNLIITFADSSGAAIAPGNLKNELNLSAPTTGNQSQFTVTATTASYSLQNITIPFSMNFN